MTRFEPCCRALRSALPLCLTFATVGCAGATCGSSEQPAGESASAPSPSPPPTEAATSTASAGTEEPDRAEQPEAETCESRLERARDSIAEVVDSHAECRWNVDCATVGIDTPCFQPCPAAVAASGVGPLRDLIATLGRELCPEYTEAGCEARIAECARATVRCHEGRCLLDEGDPTVVEAEVPEENSHRRSEPPPRPPVGDAEERARRLLDAIVHDDPDRARDFFFPMEAFREVKGIADPDRYWQRLYAAFEQDVHELHEQLADLDRAQLTSLEIVRRGGWVVPMEEGNRLPYWASRHSRLHYTVDGEERSFEVRVLITWGTRWYITHLSEFH